MKSTHRWMALMAVIFALPQLASGETYWTDDFNVDTSDIYEILEFTPGRDGAVFAFDYSTVGIPEAPSSTAGGTTGVRFFVNDPFEDTTNRTSGVQIVPIDLDQVLEGNDFTVTYDLWMNVNGPLPDGGTGSTEAMMVGVGFSGFDPIEAGNLDGTYFTVTGEGGSGTDLRTFSWNSGYNGLNPDGTSVNVAPVSLEDPFYADLFPGGIVVDDLPVQGGEDNQTGTTRLGQMAFEWHRVRVDVEGNEAMFYIDDTLLAHDKDAWVEGNVVVGLMDYFSSVSDVPEWHFSVIDNLNVASLSTLLGDFNRNGELDAPDIDLLSSEVVAGTNNLAYDLNNDELVDGMDRDVWVNELAYTYYGDADLSGEFDSLDFVQVFSAGEYEDEIVGNSTWETGDWNGDGDFDTLDFVLAFSEGGYETGPRPEQPAAVPEPSSLLLLILGIGLLTRRIRRR